MIYPQSNAFRHVYNLNGIWNFKLVNENFVPNGLEQDCRLMAVPASMNEIGTDKETRDWVGCVLYQKQFACPIEPDMQYRLRIGATSHKCKVYLNDQLIGEGINGYIPIDLPLEALKPTNIISVVIDNRLDYHTLPPGRLHDGNQFTYYTRWLVQKMDYINKVEGKQRQEYFHDFYNFTGIHRDVLVYAVPTNHINDVTVATVVDGDYSKINVQVDTDCKSVKVEVLDKQLNVVASGSQGDLKIDNPHLWQVRNSYLYTLRVTTECDCYEQKFGIRKVTYDENGLYVNDEKVYLKGFGKHEDFWFSGKGKNTPLNIRDFELLKWINANCFRTSHYPYSEEMMDLADEYGILVIDEVPFVGFLNFPDYTFGEDRADEQTKALHKEVIRQLMARDKNHPCVVMLSVANESTTDSKETNAHAYYKDVISYARTLTKLPIIIVEYTKIDDGNEVGDLVDFIGINRYIGWYDDIGCLDGIEPVTKWEFEEYYKKFRKPIILTEFGADTLEGNHTLPAESFSEEYQQEMIAEYCRVIDEIPYVIGELVWNFADFKTKQGTIRVRGNRKGVFTRERQPKRVAYYLQDRWAKKIDK